MRQDEYVAQERTLQASAYTDLCTSLLTKAAILGAKHPHKRVQIERRARKVLDRMLRRHPDKYGRR